MTHMTSDIRQALEKMSMAVPARKDAAEGDPTSEANLSRASSSSSRGRGHGGVAVGADFSDLRRTSGETLRASDFEVIKRLGEGAGGYVDKVREKSTGRVLAMKVSPGDSAFEHTLTLSRRSFQPHPIRQFTSKFSASCNSSTTVNPLTSSITTAPSSPIRTRALVC